MTILIQRNFFAEDQLHNGRLRDIAISPNGNIIYLINNGGALANKIIVYSYNGVSQANSPESKPRPTLYPNPANAKISIQGLEHLSNISSIKITSAVGQTKIVQLEADHSLDISAFSKGIHFIQIDLEVERFTMKFIEW